MATKDIQPHKFKKGQSGNPAGPRKGPQISTIIKQILKQGPPKGDDSEVLKELQAKYPKYFTGNGKADHEKLIALRSVHECYNADPKIAHTYITTLMDRIEGKAVQREEIVQETRDVTREEELAELALLTQEERDTMLALTKKARGVK